MLFGLGQATSSGGLELGLKTCTSPKSLSINHKILPQATQDQYMEVSTFVAEDAALFGLG